MRSLLNPSRLFRPPVRLRLPARKRHLAFSCGAAGSGLRYSFWSRQGPIYFGPRLVAQTPPARRLGQVEKAAMGLLRPSWRREPASATSEFILRAWAPL